MKNRATHLQAFEILLQVINLDTLKGYGDDMISHNPRVLGSKAIEWTKIDDAKEFSMG